MYITRQLEEKFLKMSGLFKAVLVTGARQVGKTTMLMHLSEEGRGYVSLDDTEMLVVARKDPRLFLMTHKSPVIIDEIQKASELFPYIKLMCNEADTPGLFWLTRSERYEMMNRSLAGRVCILNLYPLSLSEINGTAFDCPLGFPSECLTKRQSVAKPSTRTMLSATSGGAGCRTFRRPTRRRCRSICPRTLVRILLTTREMSPAA